jgi:hypothetical protein
MNAKGMHIMMQLISNFDLEFFSIEKALVPNFTIT